MYKLILALLWVSNVANAKVNFHAPVPQLNEKGGFVLGSKNWQVHYPTLWTIESDKIPDDGYVPLRTALSRKFKLAHRRVRGGNVWYRILLKNLPEKYRTGDNIIEFEFPMPVMKVYAGGKALKDISRGNTGLYRRAAISGRNFLIAKPAQYPYIFVCVKDMDFRFDNHIGQAIIRKPQILDQVYITKRIYDRPDDYQIVCGINNRLNQALKGNFVIKIQNYFGKLVRSKTVKVDLSPNGRTQWVKIRKKSPMDYKMVAQFISASGERSPFYMSWFRDGMLSKNHSEIRKYKVLDSNWASHWVKEKDGFKMPLPKTLPSPFFSQTSMLFAY